jgi:hypothetical protein
MAGHIGEDFLKDPENGGGLVRFQRQRLATKVRTSHAPVTASKVLAQANKRIATGGLPWSASKAALAAAAAATSQGHDW